MSEHIDYCHRVTADDGELGELHLRNFQDNQRKVPTILTTSRKLSTGVDARNVRNIVLLKDVKNMVEFKQIIGRGTRLYEGKNYFTIYDFESNHEKSYFPYELRNGYQLLKQSSLVVVIIPRVC